MSSTASYSFVLIATLLLHSAVFAHSWGKEGHYITCALAETLFTKATLKAVQSLLPESADGKLANVCSWPDQVRRQWNYHWSGPLHFIDTPDFQCNYNYNRDCHDQHGEPNMCLAGAINNYTSQLSTYRSGSDSKYDPSEALLFLAHFVGDIHQPLHVGFTGDEGGNTITLHWYRRKENLHHVWDTEFIDTAKKRFYNSELQGLIDDLSTKYINENADQASKWGICQGDGIACPDVYAKEAIKAACRWAYKSVTADSQLDDDYFTSRLPVVEERLAQGGVRLAAILNKIFDQ